MGVQVYSPKNINFKITGTKIDLNPLNITNYDVHNVDFTTIKEIDYSSPGEDNYIDKLKEAGATIFVGATSIVSGVLKLGEYGSDGLTWLSGSAISLVARIFGQEEFAKAVEESTMNEIARDKVGEVNEWLYEDTELGRQINDASAMKYDSELAKKIQDITTEGVLIAGATAATIMSGGTAAPIIFAAGTAVGAGQTAERKFQDVENRDFWKDSVEIGLDGTIKGLSTVAYGKAGAAGVNGVKTIYNTVSNVTKEGIKEVGKQTLSKFSKEAIKNTLKVDLTSLGKNAAINTLKDEDTWLETGAVVLDDIKTGIKTGDWNLLDMLRETLFIYGGNFAGNFAFGFADDINNLKNVDTQQLPSSNSYKDYTFNRTSNIDYITQLKANGYSDNQIVEQLANMGDTCAEFANKRDFANLSYEYLLDSGYDPKDAAEILRDTYYQQLRNRGKILVDTDSNGIKYNYVNNFNNANQAYSLDEVKQQIDGLPSDVKKTIKEVNIYDTFCPDDYIWTNNYKTNGNEIFRSAATAGNGEINIWSAELTSKNVLPHEAGHCYDINGRYSGSTEYMEAIKKDQKLTGKQSITEYGSNNTAEDFADTMAAYKNGYVYNKNGEYSYIEDFPNRKEYIEKILKYEGQEYLTIHNFNQINEVANTLYNKFNLN